MEPAGQDGDVTRLLDVLSDAATRREDALFEQSYRELRRIAQRLMVDRPIGQTLDATGLVNEAYLKLVQGAPVEWRDRRHFINTVARAMRQVLIDRARTKASDRRGGGRARVELDHVSVGAAESFPVDRVEELAQVIERLRAANARWAEIVELRFFTGLTIDQTAEAIGVSSALVRKDWRFARGWLTAALREGES
jgi:RNA polymerase sigma factor (TIGR02999 family)